MALVSVILPLHRIDEFTPLAIESVLASSAVDLELIIVCDRLPVQQLQPLLGQTPDLRVKIFSSEKTGITSALNMGISKAAGSLIARMDGDDVCHPDRFRIQAKYLSANPRVSMVGTAIELVCKHGTNLGARRFPRHVATCPLLKPFSSPVAHPSVMIRSSALAKGNVYRELFEGFQAEDFDLWYRILGVGRIDNLSRKLLKYRLHANQISTVNSREVALSSVAVVMLDLYEPNILTSLDLTQWRNDPEGLISYLASPDNLKRLSPTKRLRAHVFFGYIGAFSILQELRAKVFERGPSSVPSSYLEFTGKASRVWSWALAGFVASLHLANAFRLLLGRLSHCRKCKAEGL